MLYAVLKFIWSYVVRKYFAEIHIKNAEEIPYNKPVLLLPNHRSAFMDPIVVATQLNRTANFLTRGESFEKPIMVKIFKQLNMIPIYRKEHNPEKVNQNEDIFRHCHQLMKENGCLIIFPEGICQTKYTLAPLKTGAARIALEAEAKNNFKLDIHVIPIGINYSNPHRFRGRLTLNIGKSLRPKDYKDEFEKDYWAAISHLTADVENNLKELIVTVDDQHKMKLVEHIETFMESSDVSDDWHNQRKRLVEQINSFKENDAVGFDKFNHTMSSYMWALQKLKLGTSSFKRSSHKGLQRYPILHFILLVFGFPIFIIGFLLHFLPFVFTQQIALRVVKRVDFMGSVLLALGLLMFAIFCVLETWIVWKLSGNGWATIIFFFLWPSLGLFAYSYLSSVGQWLGNINWRFLGKKRKGLQTALKQTKIELNQTIVTIINS
ncbi:MAG: 1-acyl-sn-glycerol-3-phosphate acyltransferase [Flavobacteriales bacterium]|nr:1-acyl-sn-glycerol-3-phosphate acyltransferase [Flavobacteriales bacterium]